MTALRARFGLRAADRTARLTLWQSFAAMLGISLAMMLSSLDQTIVGNALPTMAAELNGFDLYAWVATSYMLCSMIAIPVFGRLGDYFGRKPFVLAATLTFTLASAACAIAGSMAELVVARSVQGLGGGMIIGSAFASIPEIFPNTRERLRWQIMLSVVSSVANATGPVLGGVLTDQWGWRSIFLINIPLGLLATLWAWRFLPFYKPVHGRDVQVDWTGAVLVVLTLVGLQLFVDRIPTGDAHWLVPLGLMTTVAAVLLVRCERRAPDALLPPHLFGTDSLRRLFTLAVLAGALMYVLLFYLPLLFQGGYGYSPKDAGLLVTPLALLMTIGAIINGRIVTRVERPNRLLGAGLAALTLCSAGLALAGAQATFAQLLGLTLLGGFGLGFTMLNLTVFTQTLAPTQYVGIATAMQKSLRLVGGMVGAAVMAALLSWLYGHRLAALLGSSNPVEVLTFFSNPQVLVPGPQNALGEQPPEAVALARAALRETLSIGLLMLTAAGAWALWLLRKVPVIRLR